MSPQLLPLAEIRSRGLIVAVSVAGVGGSIEINGEKATPEDIRAFSGFVAQVGDSALLQSS